MKLAVTVDEVRGTHYTVGKYDFYTRQLEIDPDIGRALSEVGELLELQQRILSAMYNSNGKYILPEDLEKFRCAVAKLAPATPEAESAKPRRQRASVVLSSSGSVKPSQPEA